MISYILIGLAVLAGVIGLLCGLSRRTPRQLMHLASIALAAVLAYVSAHPLASFILQKVKVSETLGMPGMDVQQLSGLTDYMQAILLPVVAIFLFVVLFFIFWLLLKIPCALVARALLGKERKSLFPGDRAVGAVLGVVGGLACFCLFLVPVAGLVRTGVDALHALPEEQRKPLTSLEVVSGLENDRILQFSASFCGLYDGLMTTRIGDMEISLTKEIPAIVAVYAHAEPLLTEATPTAAMGATRQVLEDICENPLLCVLLADVVSEAARAWQDGLSFLQVPPPEVEAMYEPLYREMLALFSTATARDISMDLKTLSEAMGLLMEHGVTDLLASEGEDSSRLLTEKLSEEGLVSGFLTVLSKNPRTAPLVSATVDSGMGSMFFFLRASTTKEEIRSSLLQTTAWLLNGKREALQENLRRAFWEAGLATDDVLMQKISKALNAAFAKGSDVTEEALDAFFAEAFDLEKEKQVREGAATEEAASDACTTQARKLRGELYDLRLGAQDSVDWALVQGLCSAQAFETTRSVYEDLLTDPAKISAVTGDALAQEFQHIEDVVGQIARFTLSEQDAKRKAEERGEASIRVEDLALEELDVAVDLAMKSQILEGKGDHLMNVVIHSTLMQELLPVVVRERLGSGLSLEDPESDLGNVFMVVKSVMEIKETLTNWKEVVGEVQGEVPGEIAGEVQIEKLESKVDWLVENMTPQTAEVLSEMLSPEVVKEYGIPDEYAQGVSELVGLLFEKFGNQ